MAVGSVARTQGAIFRTHVTETGRRIAIGLAAVTAILGVAVAVSVAGQAPPPVSTGSLEPRISLPADAPDLTVQSFKGFSVLPGVPTEPAGRDLQSRLWTIDGRWWGAMVEPASRETRIYELSLDGATWSDTGVLLDERAGAMSDVLWSGDHLYVASAVPGRSTSNGVRVSRFSRQPGGRFLLDPNFPIPVTERGVTAVSFARDESGRLWVAFVQDGRVLVAHSSVDEAVWDAPRPVPDDATAVGPDDVAVLVDDESGNLGLIWSDANERSIRFAARDHLDAPEQWSESGVAFEGLPLAEDPISAAAGGDGTIFVAVETAVADAPDAGQSDPGSVILARDADGVWRSALIARVEDHLGQQIVLVDRAGAEVYVFGTSPRHGGTIHVKRAGIDRLEFPPGRGLPVIEDPSNPDIAYLTSTKQSIDIENSLVVLGFDEETGFYWHALVAPAAGAVAPSETPVASDTGSSGASPPPSGPSPLFTDNFDPWPPTGPIGNGWAIGPADARGTLTAVADGSNPGLNALLQATAPATVRACKSFVPTAAGSLVSEVRVRVEQMGAADAVITSLRDQSGESVSVRFGQGGTFAYYSGEVKVRSAVPIRLNSWYRSAVAVNLDSRRYDWRLSSDDGSRILEVKGIPFRESAATQVSEICVQTSVGATGAGLRFDDVRVSR
jgi:hypothetical protein